MTDADVNAVSDVQAALDEREPTLGERLRAARDAQPLSLTQIAAELRIEPKFLESLEADRLADFPAPVFAKGFLKQYGGMLGLDERDLLAQYYRQAEVRETPVLHHKPIRLRDEDRIRHWMAAGLVLLVLAGGAVAWWTARPVVEPITVEREPEAGSLAPVTAPVPESRPGQGVASAATLDAAPVVTSEAAVDEQPAPEIGPEPAGTLIELSFAEDCWTEISDARGERLFYGLGSAGARSRFSATLPISVFFGNAAGVRVSVNGEPYPIPAGSRQGNLARFVIAEPGL